MNLPQKGFQSLSENSEGEQQLNTPIITFQYGNISKIEAALYSSIKSSKQNPIKKQTNFKYILKKLIYFCELAWLEIMPSSLVSGKLLGTDLAGSIKQTYHNILLGSWENMIEHCRASGNELFAIMVYKFGAFKKQHQIILNELKKILIIPVHIEQTALLGSLGIEDQVEIDPILHFCKFNCCQQLIIFGEMSMKTTRQSCRQILKGIIEIIEEYQKLQSQIEEIVEAEADSNAHKKGAQNDNS